MLGDNEKNKLFQIARNYKKIDRKYFVFDFLAQNTWNGYKISSHFLGISTLLLKK